MNFLVEFFRFYFFAFFFRFVVIHGGLTKSGIELFEMF